MSGKRSRVKGSRGELELRDILREFGIDAHRIPRSGADKDLPWHGDIRGMEELGYHIEAKRTERLALYAALSQAEGDCPDGLEPLVIFRRNRDKWRVVVDLEHFLGVIGLERRDVEASETTGD